MGQYHDAVVEMDNEKGYERYNTDKSMPQRDGWIGQKLMEHSWIGNEFVESVAMLLYHSPRRVMWMGDYTEPSDFERIRKNHIGVVLPSMNSEYGYSDILDVEPITMEHKFLVNHDKKLYIDMDKYIEKNSDDGWAIHPLPLLTSVSNGRGGGDYCGINEDSVGAWEWDKLSVEDDVDKSQYNELNVSFKEE